MKNRIRDARSWQLRMILGSLRKRLRGYDCRVIGNGSMIWRCRLRALWSSGSYMIVMAVARKRNLPDCDQETMMEINDNEEPVERVIARVSEELLLFEVANVTGFQPKCNRCPRSLRIFK